MWDIWPTTQGNKSRKDEPDLNPQRGGFHDILNKYSLLMAKQSLLKPTMVFINLVITQLRKQIIHKDLLIYNTNFHLL